VSLRLPLQLHPDSRCDALSGIVVELVRLSPRRILVGYLLSGNLRHIDLPRENHHPQRRDELWRHTCFEAFVRAEGDEAYYEFNLAPSRDWAAYRFDGYRRGMTAAREVDAPHGDPTVHAEPRPPAFRATLELERAASLPIDRPWRIGLSAVIEERNGRISYWALAHPPGKPDFHHPDCFQLELPAARPA
jgi:hypothetical protein